MSDVAPAMADPGLAVRLATIRENIVSAMKASGRPVGSVSLIAASKWQSEGAIRQVHALGLREFGENYAQELSDKAEHLGDIAPRWHFIGRFQKNKINLLKSTVSLWQTIASVSDGEALLKRVPEAPFLVEVNLGGEPQKSGVVIAELEATLAALAGKGHLRGLMTIPPEGPAEKWFSLMAELFTRYQAYYPSQPVLSMGMSQDYALAIRYGATMVRVGTALFGPRPT